MPDQPRPSLDARRALQWALLALPLVVLAERAWARRWMSDDGFINLRVVRQVTSGHGPVFNAGERVEASTSPLWTFVLTVGDLVTPVRLEWVAVLAGIALTLIGVAFAIDGARRLIPARAGELSVPVGAAVLVAVTPVWTFSSSGLEGGLTTAWLGASLWVLARWAPERARLPWWSAAVLGLGPLIRPDLGIFMVLFLAVVLVARREEDRWADRGRFLLAALALPVAYQIFRMGYYASLVPNPALAKEAGGSSRWGVGWDYLWEFVEPYALWLPLLVLAVGAYVPLARSARREGRTTPLLVAGAFVAGGLLEAVYIVRVGGDFMHARLLLPAFFAFVAPVAVVPLRREYALSLLVLPWCLVGLLFLRADADDVGAFGTGEENLVTLADFGWQPGGPQRAWFDGTGVYYTTAKLDAETVDGRDAEVASYGLGVIGYSLGPDVYVLDLLGLGDPFASHLELSRRGLIGHEKPLPAPWIVARLTPPGTDLTEDDFPFPTRFGARPLDDPDGVPFADRVERARETLVCAELERFLDSYTEELTPGRFLSNVLHAPGYTAMRIPPEPADAYRELCG